MGDARIMKVIEAAFAEIVGGLQSIDYKQLQKILVCIGEKRTLSIFIFNSFCKHNTLLIEKFHMLNTPRVAMFVLILNPSAYCYTSLL